MDNREDQIFGLIGAAQEHQRAMTNELAALRAERDALNRVTAELREAVTKSVPRVIPALQGAVQVAVFTALETTSSDAVAAVGVATVPLIASIRDAVQAAEAAQNNLNRVTWRLVGMLAAGAAGCIAAVLIAGWISLTWQRGQVSNLKQEKAALMVEVADLKATADKLTARGGQAALTMCTINPQKSLPCVRVNADHGSYGDKNKGVYYVIHGY